jgi:hypothetical protein
MLFSPSTYLSAIAPVGTSNKKILTKNTTSKKFALCKESPLANRKRMSVVPVISLIKN